MLFTLVEVIWKKKNILKGKPVKDIEENHLFLLDTKRESASLSF